MTGTGGEASPATIVRPFAETWAAHSAELDAFRQAIGALFWDQWQREVVREVRASNPLQPVETFEDAVAVLVQRPTQGLEG